MALMRLNYSYVTYQCLEIVIPSVIVFLTLIHFIISISLFLCNCCNCAPKSRGWSERFFTDIIYPYANILFRNSLKKSTEDDKVKLHRYKIDKYKMFLLSPLTSLIKV